MGSRADDRVIRGPQVPVGADDEGTKYGAAGRVLSPLSIVPIACSTLCRYLMSIFLLDRSSRLISEDRKIVPQYSSPEFCW